VQPTLITSGPLPHVTVYHISDHIPMRLVMAWSNLSPFLTSHVIAKGRFRCHSLCQKWSPKKQHPHSWEHTEQSIISKRDPLPLCPHTLPSSSCDSTDSNCLSACASGHSRLSKHLHSSSRVTESVLHLRLCEKKRDDEQRGPRSSRTAV
jgi:hypothetical protein